MNKIIINVDGKCNSGKSTIIELIKEMLIEKGFDNIMVHSIDNIELDKKTLNQRIEAVKNIVDEIDICEMQLNRNAFTEENNESKTI